MECVVVQLCKSVDKVSAQVRINLFNAKLPRICRFNRELTSMIEIYQENLIT